MAEHRPTEDEFHAALRTELMRAAAQTYDAEPARYPRRRRPWLIAAAAAAVFAVTVGVLTARDTRPVSADVEVVIDGDDLILRLTDRLAHPEEIESAAAELGLNISIRELPVSPRNVGKFVGNYASGLPPELEPLDGQSKGFTGFRIPKDWDGRLVLYLGRPAKPGERWHDGANALAEGSPAECMQLIGLSVAAAATEVEDLDASVRWIAIDQVATTYLEHDISKIRDWVVVAVDAADQSAIEITVTPDGSWHGPPNGIEPPTNPDC